MKFQHFNIKPFLIILVVIVSWTATITTTTTYAQQRHELQERTNKNNNQTPMGVETTTTAASIQNRRNSNKRRFTQTTTTTTTSCIGDDQGLRTAIATASNSSTTTTILTLCSRIKIDPTKRNTLSKTYANFTGIDVSTKNIELLCYNPFGKRCILDGQRQSRIFYGTKVLFEANDIDFINSNLSALFFFKSDVAFNRCSFRNNTNMMGEGSAIFVRSTKLTLRANSSSPMMFSNNHARFGGSIRADQRSNVAAITSHIVFHNNTSEGGGTLSISDSTLIMKGVAFTHNRIGGALHMGSSTVTITNTNFYNNTVVGGYSYGWIYMFDTKATFQNVRFIDNVVRNSTTYVNGLSMLLSKVQLNNCTFWKNKCYSSSSNNNNNHCYGMDLTIVDNRDSKKDRGSYVSCSANATQQTVFCNGVSIDRIYDERPIGNTNCSEVGITRICRL